MNKSKIINIANLYSLFAILSISFINSNFSIRYILFIITLFLGFLFLVMKKNVTIKFNGIRYYIPIILAIIAGISLKLSGFWDTGKIRYLLFIYEMIIIISISNNYNKKGSLKILGEYFITLIFLNLIFLFFFRSYSMYYYGGELVFRGLYYEKNYLGYNLLMGIPIFIDLIKSNVKGKRIFYYILLFISLYLIYLSKSTTSILLSIIMVLLSMNTKEKNLKLFKIIPILIIIFIIYLFNYDEIISSSFNTFITNFIGKGLDFTGRSTLWFFSLEMFTNKPILGYGFLGLWSDQNYVTYVMEQMGYAVVGFHAHNGYIELLLSTGIVGAFLYFLILHYIFTNINRDYIFNKITNSEIIILFIILISNFVNNSLISLSFSFVFIILLYFKIIYINRVKVVENESDS